MSFHEDGIDLERAWSMEGIEIPAVVRELAGGAEPVLAWRNVVDGLTFRIPRGFVKWDPPSTGADLAREARAARWLAARHPAPRPLEEGVDAGGARWMLAAPLAGESAVSERWRGEPETAVRAIATGLRALHGIPLAGAPDWLREDSWVTRRPAALGPRPPLDEPVLVHGDACAPNTLLDAGGAFAAHVDLGDLAIGDRWADLAVAGLSLGWNYGPGWEPLLWASYGIEPDPGRIDWYRRLWDAES
ncbi:phosphotransferase [Homoserinibacter sp. YIM 151385]|uniref:phosphotransferase n=1 Tax=Homoserinibacter sp. YIM 151385 TaxID=2985506 RepID=UPI0022F0B6B2|nr:phosphotransferase [Homoserinibacter sp. YIM 151385]WBU38929.1 phosphotransferase [Homoserinibacter sp. YIM 151385]